MTFRYFRHLAFIVVLLRVTRAQQSNIVPEDLQGGFKSNGKEVQVSYTNDAVDGFKDGTTFEKDAVANEPTFALGDSSGISPTTLYTIIMIDTTCPNARKLHYARANFKNNFKITNIETESAALLDYKAPGELGETGDDRQYSFLMYTNPGRKRIDQLKLPAEGDSFDVEQFQSDNGLPDAAAGVGMVVKLGGTADCGGEQPSDTPDDSPSTQPAQSSAAEETSVDAGPTSTASSADEQQSSSAAIATPTQDTNEPESTTSPSSTADEPEGSSDSGPSTTSSRQTSSLIAASSVVQTDAPGPSTITSTVVQSSRPGGAGASGSPTASASLTEQTANAALGAPTTYGLAIAPWLAVAGVLLW